MHMANQKSLATLITALLFSFQGAAFADDSKPDSEAPATSASGVFLEQQAPAPKTETQERAAKAIADRYPNAKMESLGGGEGTRRGYRAAPFIATGLFGFMQARFKAEVACSEVSLDGKSPPVFDMFFISPKERRGVLVVDTPVSAAACAPKGDKRRTGAGLKEFRDLMEAHDAYSKNLFRKLFGK